MHITDTIHVPIRLLLVLEIFHKFVVEHDRIVRFFRIRAVGRTQCALVQYHLCHTCIYTHGGWTVPVLSQQSVSLTAVLHVAPLPGIVLIMYRNGVVSFPSYSKVCLIALGHWGWDTSASTTDLHVHARIYHRVSVIPNKTWGGIIYVSASQIWWLSCYRFSLNEIGWVVLYH